MKKSDFDNAKKLAEKVGRELDTIEVELLQGSSARTLGAESFKRASQKKANKRIPANVNILRLP